MELQLAFLTFFVSVMRQTGGHPVDSPGPGSPDRRNMTLDSVRNAYPPIKGRGENNFDPKDNLSMDKIQFVMYAGRIIGVLHKDPNYPQMKEKLSDPTAGMKTIYELYVIITEESKKKMTEIKKEELARIERMGVPKESQPKYIDYDKPDIFTGFDLHLMIGQVAQMRHVLEEFIHGKKPPPPK